MVRHSFSVVAKFYETEAKYFSLLCETKELVSDAKQKANKVKQSKKAKQNKTNTSMSVGH
jgi:hypothetical protein